MPIELTTNRTLSDSVESVACAIENTGDTGLALSDASEKITLGLEQIACALEKVAESIQEYNASQAKRR